MNNKLNGLTKPLRLGRLNVKNRIWNSPLWTRTASAEGEVTERTIAHYVARAKGGTGVISTEGVAVDGRHTWVEPQMRLDHNRFAPGHRRLVEEVHMYNVPIICQLHHAGMFGNDPVSPSGIPCQDMGKIGQFIEPRELTTKEVEEIRDMFIAAAERAHEVGYDGVELHGSTAYLLEQFYSPHNNKRTDKYGGSLQGRMQLALEIVRGIRANCGPHFVIGYTVVDCDMIEGGITREQTTVFAKELERAGINYLDLQTDGTYETFHLVTASAGYRRQPLGQFDKTEYYKSILNIPVVTRGAGQYNPIEWNEAFENDRADAVRLGKQMLADPDVAGKAVRGDLEDIRSCIKCGNCLFSGEISNWQLSCAVNSGCGRMDKPVTPALVSKNVLVIGAGPAGLEAARVAALRGHSVTLVEKQEKVGGNLYIASLPVSKDDLMKFAIWAEKQCEKLGVTIKLNTEATAEMVDELKPDVVIVASGSNPLVPPIKGVDMPHVVTAEDVLQGKVKVGNNVVVAGAGEVGLETADSIMENYEIQNLTVVEMQKEVGADMSPLDKAMLFHNDSVFPKHMRNGLKIVTETKLQEITEKGVRICGKNWNEYEVEADTVVLALGYVANNKIVESLNEKVSEVYVVGDAVRARKIADAVYQANYFASRI
ncbi:FAD-dependent oxidoreductase [Oceanirhabdus seepicola]|uniref:FAD-dependent oxidoreductase n=1 Tax=Oceanirhabdus seepicola TaxID=2828781 RepID=A0A9J6NXR3_9CLOT|nr:FAD-dependent oxidoreductase [Oceanirhabdus seepicola]MCM1989051.1 FAD-dependent oxidoreductase [Oceanirhabdus seepicola]